MYTSSCLGWFVTGSIKKECHCPRAVVLPQVDEANLTELEEALEGWGSSLQLLKPHLALGHMDSASKNVEASFPAPANDAKQSIIFLWFHWIVSIF